MSKKDQLEGELGTLKQVRIQDLSSCRIFLTIEHENAHYIGCLFLEDLPFCTAMYDLLKNRIERKIKDIADSELDYPLQPQASQ
jgi:hypothetical protein